MGPEAGAPLAALSIIPASATTLGAGNGKACLTSC